MKGDNYDNYKLKGFILLSQVVDWVLGPGEKLLASQNDIGDSYEAAEELRRRHEEMEIKCTVSKTNVLYLRIIKETV